MERRSWTIHVPEPAFGTRPRDVRFCCRLVLMGFAGPNTPRIFFSGIGSQMLFFSHRGAIRVSSYLRFELLALSR